MDVKKEIVLIQFGKHVKSIRLKNKLSQDDVVLNSNKITKGTISDIENGKRNLSFTTLFDLAQGLNVSLKDLCDFNIPDK